MMKEIRSFFNIVIKLFFAPIILPYYLVRKLFRSKEVKETMYKTYKKPMTAERKTWVLIAVWSILSISILTIILDSIFGLTTRGESKNITVFLVMLFTAITSVFIYRNNPFSIQEKINKTNPILRKNLNVEAPEKTLIETDKTYDQQKRFEEHGISEKQFDQAFNLYNRPIFKSRLNPVVAEDLYTIQSGEFKLLNDLGLVSQESNYPYMITINDNKKDIKIAKKFMNYRKNNSIYIPKLDRLDELENGFEFENYIAELLQKLNYENIEILQKSNDYGADVLAEKNGIKYAIQCKYYSGAVGITAVQEIIGGTKHHNAHVPIVATNNVFTKNADELAKSNNVVLWDRQQLLRMITEVNS